MEIATRHARRSGVRDAEDMRVQCSECDAEYVEN